MQRAVTNSGDKGRRQATNPSLDRKSGICQPLRQPHAGAFLFEAKLRVCMDTVAESNQTITGCVETFACAGFSIHCFSPSVADTLGSLLETFQAVAFGSGSVSSVSPFLSSTPGWHAEAAGRRLSGHARRGASCCSCAALRLSMTSAAFSLRQLNPYLAFQGLAAPDPSPYSFAHYV